MILIRGNGGLVPWNVKGGAEAGHDILGKPCIFAYHADYLRYENNDVRALRGADEEGGRAVSR